MSSVAATKPPARRKRDPLAGPRHEVIYIFEREGSRGGPYWLLVLACGHAVSRRRHDSSNFVQTMFRPLSEKLAPQHAQCHYCGMGAKQCDPWVLIQVLEPQK